MITLYRYTLPFTRPIATRHGMLTERTGLLVRDGDKWGEAAPWPGLSRESLTAAEAELKTWLRLSPKKRRSYIPCCDSVRVALDSIGAKVGTTLRAVRQIKRTTITATKIPINGLLSDEPVDSALPALISAGFRTVKIKVGRQAIRADAERVTEVHRQLGPDVKLRLDANRAWSLADALDFAKRIAGVPLEYIEEPLRTPAKLEQFHARTGRSVALDESLRDLPIDKFFGRDFVCALIIKPMISSGLRGAEWVAELAMEMGWSPVFSAVYESGVGIRTLARLAARCGAPGVAMGFDTYRCLAADVLQPRLTIRDGMLDLAEAERAEVCVEKLQELS